MDRGGPRARAGRRRRRLHSDDDDPGPGRPSSTGAVPKVNLTFGVWGTKNEIDAYQAVVDTYNASNDEASVKIKAYPTHDDLIAALDSGEVPDVFLVSRGDLPDLQEQELNQPIGDLLDDRDVDFGDGYSRPALEAFASDRELQCMPYGISPMVIYYNRKLVDFQAMAERGLDVPTVDDEDLAKKPTWSLEQFQIAAEYASRPRRGDRRLLRRADAAWAGAVHLLRRRQGLRRRRRADLAGLLLRRHQVGAGEGAAAAARPQAVADAGAARPRRRRWSGSARASSA